MTSKVYFYNQGAIDVQALTTFGVSAKDDSREDIIGFFGTGLKYAIAILLREGQNIKITTSNAGTYNFGLMSKTIRDKQFYIVTMNGQPLGFTIDLGKTWEVWQAYRELYCNCKDEDGTISDYPPTDLTGEYTLIEVSGDKFVDVHRNRDLFILPDHLPRERFRLVEFITIPSNSVYYRNMLAGSLPDRSVFTYNILKELPLTEDRTLKEVSSIRHVVASALVNCENEAIITRALMAGKDTFEWNLPISYHAPGEAFLEVSYKLLRRYGQAQLHPSIVDILVKSQLIDEDVLYEGVDISAIQRDTLLQAIDICHRAGFMVDIKNVVVTHTLNGSAWAQVHKNKIYLAKRIFTQGKKFIVTTLIEEQIHLETGYSDYSFNMQEHLLGIITDMIEEHVIGESI